MTSTRTDRADGRWSRGLWSGGLARVIALETSALTSFFLLIGVVPGYAIAGGDPAWAGAVTATLMGAVLLAEVAGGALIRRIGNRAAAALGCLLVALPSLALLASADLAAVLVGSVLRGIGFGVLFVLCGALAAQAVPTDRRGEGLGWYGLLSGLPAVLALPLGLLAADRFGAQLVFVAGAVTALGGLLVLPKRSVRPGSAVATPGSPGRTGSDDTGVVARMCIVLAASTVATGVLVTFLPVALATGSIGAVAALTGQAVVAMVTRWWAGKQCDRRDPAVLVSIGIVCTAAGLATLAGGSPLAIAVAMGLLGVGVGMIQSATLTAIFAAVPADRFASASSAWNLAYDAGLGGGALAFGWIVGPTGFEGAFVLTGLAVLAALLAVPPRSRVPAAAL